MLLKTSSLAALFLGLASSVCWAGTKYFEVILNNGVGTILTADDMKEQWNPVSFGVALDADGKAVRVESDDASAIATISGKYHSDHGCSNLKITFEVEGPVTIKVGQCSFSSSDIVVKNAAGETVASKTPTTACWKNDHTNVTEVYYTGGAAKLTVSGMSYCPYFGVAPLESIVTQYEIAFAMGDAAAEGSLPAGSTWSEGDSYTLPQNFTLYKEGYTLTGWNDGEATYAVGAAYTPKADVTLTPVFTQNTKALADRTGAVTVKWDFQRKNGAPTLAIQGSSNGLGVYVTQATVDGETLDVKLDYDATSGKIANANWTDWAQMNGGTKFTIPSAQGAVVSLEAYSAPTTTTIDGQTDYTASENTISYTVGSKAETIDIVIGDGSYYRYIQVVLPAVASYALTIGDLGYSTLCLPQTVSVPDDLSACYGTYDATNRWLVLTTTKVIEARTAVVIEGAAGTYTLNVTESTGEAVQNDLKGNPNSVAMTPQTDATVCVLSCVDDQIGFYRWTGEIPGRKGYLEVPASASNKGAGVRIVFANEPGNVSAIERVPMAQEAADGACYDLCGRRMKGQPAAGIYVRGGKKVLVR